MPSISGVAQRQGRSYSEASCRVAAVPNAVVEAKHRRLRRRDETAGRYSPHRHPARRRPSSGHSLPAPDTGRYSAEVRDGLVGGSGDVISTGSAGMHKTGN